MDKEAVKELIQVELHTKNLTVELAKILDGEHRTKMLDDYTVLEKKLGGKGASQKTAALILKNA